jgi:hypothetical protein
MSNRTQAEELLDKKVPTLPKKYRDKILLCMLEFNYLMDRELDISFKIRK